MILTTHLQDQAQGQTSIANRKPVKPNRENRDNKRDNNEKNNASLSYFSQSHEKPLEKPVEKTVIKNINVNNPFSPSAVKTQHRSEDDLFYITKPRLPSSDSSQPYYNNNSAHHPNSDAVTHRLPSNPSPRRDHYIHTPPRHHSSNGYISSSDSPRRISSADSPRLSKYDELSRQVYRKDSSNYSPQQQFFNDSSPRHYSTNDESAHNFSYNNAVSADYPAKYSTTGEENRYSMYEDTKNTKDTRTLTRRYNNKLELDAGRNNNDYRIYKDVDDATYANRFYANLDRTPSSNATPFTYIPGIRGFNSGGGGKPASVTCPLIDGSYDYNARNGTISSNRSVNESQSRLSDSSDLYETLPAATSLNEGYHRTFSFMLTITNNQAIFIL